MTMTQSATSFFEEVRVVYAETAAAAGLTGPTETERILPVSRYKGGGVEYAVSLDVREGAVECDVSFTTDALSFTVDIEPLAIAAGIVDKRGGISYSARNLKQLHKSLLDQAYYVRRVHPLLTADAATTEDLMRRARAREWHRHRSTPSR
ncbi:hypothetical protein [Streptomyces griseorubiginosus]|uniref:hypothetical protein n=1 Tax=Streptomyces griseorubiginosus TaxID=67304 RepID=UPI001AD7C79D|nr:hypothetical protein [Streptomyces griseorubiginosus]MBO4254226.1 hypothetical protein [Streptomyces griseorubiginosus]